MATTRNTAGAQLKETIAQQDLAQRQGRLELAIKDYIENCKDSRRHPCAALMNDLFGGNAYMAVDVVFQMKSTVTDILVLLTDPQVAEKFKDVRRGGWSHDFGEHLRRMLLFLDWADNKLCYAEMALYDIETNGLSEAYVAGLERDYGLQ